MASDSDGLTVGPTAAMGLGQAPQASLMGMPTELLLQIVEAVTDKQDIMSLRYTSSRLSSAAQPELFKRFAIRIQRRDYCTSFLQTITMRPSLGAHIKELHFWVFKRQDPNPCYLDNPDGDTIFINTCWNYASPPLPLNIARSAALAAEVGDIERKLHAGLEDNDGEAILVSLLRHLPKLEVLTVWLDGFELGSTPKPRLLANFLLSLAANRDPSRPLANLKEASFATLDNYRMTWDHLWNALSRLHRSTLLWTRQKDLWITAWSDYGEIAAWGIHREYEFAWVSFDLFPKERPDKHGRYSQQAMRMSYADVLYLVRRFRGG